METTTSINSLIIINNDRYEGYKKAADETKDADLKALFTKYSLQSKGFGESLRPFSDTEDQPKQNETTNSGKLYRVWMDVKAAMTANDRKAILSSCEFGEDVAKKTYDEVLEHADSVPSEVLDIIRKHRSELQKAHDEVKALRDAGK
ncbi:MAG: PA2169 family four-helix-bundle protein [Bacteroidetes bacterium]|nr:PA2169 family four-helix-bundle protein [Bacteroidota bacterium]